MKACASTSRRVTRTILAQTVSCVSMVRVDPFRRNVVRTRRAQKAHSAVIQSVYPSLCRAKRLMTVRVALFVSMACAAMKLSVLKNVRVQRAYRVWMDSVISRVNAPMTGRAPMASSVERAFAILKRSVPRISPVQWVSSALRVSASLMANAVQTDRAPMAYTASIAHASPDRNAPTTGHVLRDSNARNRSASSYPIVMMIVDVTKALSASLEIVCLWANVVRDVHVTMVLFVKITSVYLDLNVMKTAPALVMPAVSKVAV